MTDNLTSGNYETLSALMDDEAHELELRGLLRDMDRAGASGEAGAAAGNPAQGDGRVIGGGLAAQERWYRYNLVRATLGGEAPVPAPGFAASVRAAIDEEVPLVSSGGSGWRRSLGSLAVAASVAAIVVIGGQQLATSGNSAVAPASRIASLPVGVVNTAGAMPVQASFGTRALPALQPADRTAYRELARQRLRRYSQQHAEHASLNTPQGLVPFARVPRIEE